jgi:probable F420-dependent oxidoreductase
MREYIEALRAIWTAWQTDGRLDFRGDFYQHTLMTPMFCPGSIDALLPRIDLAAVGPKMTETAAEVADGLLVHGFTTRRYEEEHLVPTLQAALDRAGRARAEFQVVMSPFIVTGTTEEEMRQSATAIKGQIAFYASTPSYRPVLDAHGWGNLQTDLAAMTKRGEWAQMSDTIDDEMLEAFAVVSEPQDLPSAMRERVAGVADVVSLPQTAVPKEHLAAAIKALKSPINA